MSVLSRWAAAAVTALGLLATSGCTTTSLLVGAAGVASDSSVAWDIVKHIHTKLTEGDPTPCSMLDSVERALSPRCGAFVAGSVREADLASSPFAACALTSAASDARLWPALPELIAKGGRPQTCAQPPAVALAQAQDCPDLAAQTPEVRGAIVGLARTDTRAVQPDVVRWLSCPASRAIGADAILETWLADASLLPGTIPFNPLSALHPSAVNTPLSAALEAQGHRADTALASTLGLHPSGFEEALRTSDWAALDWWLTRAPQLANRVPGPQLDWLPLARVMSPNFLVYPDSRAAMVDLLIAHGADPRTRLPHDPGQSVLTMARASKSPLLAVLEAAPAGKLDASPIVAANGRALRLIAVP